MRREPLRVGLVGYGLGGMVFHAPLIATTPGLELTAVVTNNAERRAHLRERHPRAHAADTVDQLFADPSALDLVVVASPNRTHVPFARAALEAGLPVVVDKPLAADANEARDLAALAQQRGLMLSVFHNRRWDNDFLTLRRLIEAGEMGRVFRFESRFERWRPQVSESWRERAEPAEAGGTLFDLGSHLIDQALLLFGPVTHVYAELGMRRAGAKVDDDAFVALAHASGVRSHLWMSACTAMQGPRFRVLGDKAGFEKHGLDPQEATLRSGRWPDGDSEWGVEPDEAWGVLGAGDDVRVIPSEHGAYPGYYARVASALHDGAAPPVDVRDAVAGLVIIEAARRSASQSGPVVIGA
jgi:predicted dehydrogenase